MNSLIEDFVKLYLNDNPGIFGAGATFLNFVVGSQYVLGIGDVEYVYTLGSISYLVQDTHKLSDPLLVKSFNFERGRGEYEAFAREVTFFQKVVPEFRRVLPAVSLNFLPDCYATGASMSRSSNGGTLLFEGPKAVVLDGTTRLDATTLMIMVRMIADIHACSFLIRDQNPQLWRELSRLATKHICVQRTLPKLRQRLQHFLASADGRTRYQSRLQYMLDNFEDLVNRPFSVTRRNSCFVLCHRNYSKFNQLNHYEDGAKAEIYNWHSACLASLAVDLAIVLFVDSIDSCKARISHFLQGYREKLEGVCGALTPSLEDITKEVRKCIPFAFYVMADRVVTTETGNWPAQYPADLWTDNLLDDLFESLARNRLLDRDFGESLQ